jgi:hypothetical protein
VRKGPFLLLDKPVPLLCHHLQMAMGMEAAAVVVGRNLLFLLQMAMGMAMTAAAAVVAGRNLLFLHSC